MEAVLPIMLQMAIAADRLTSGRGKEFVTQDTRIWSAKLSAPAGESWWSQLVIWMVRYLQALTAPIGIRNIAKNRAPVDVAPVAMALPTADTHMRHMMWMDLSLVLDEVNVTHTDVRNVANCQC